MGKINVLSFEIANLIAAGEVVERPSSVLKELMENSIDAGATEIVAEIKRGGVSLIRITDNGCGIEKEDLPVALKRHATSKIKEKDDLASIMTLGFRGEALAAISSVSDVTIITRTKDSDTGYMLTSEAGKMLDISEVGCAEGTTVVVENLFYNVPARRKFLKKDATEAMNVTALVEKVALSRPDISIQLLIDGEEKFKTPGDSRLINTIRAIFGKDFASKLIEVKAEADGIKVSGYIGRSDNVRKNRNLENVFVNGRYVKSITAQTAIERAYTSYIAPECFPACVLFIDMNPSIVDVNVHPAKLEVKFSDERRIFEAVYYSVKNTLEGYEYRPDMTLGTKERTTDFNKNPVAAFVPIGESTKGKQVNMNDVITSPRNVAEAPRYVTPEITAESRQRSIYTDRPLNLRSIDVKSPRQDDIPRQSDAPRQTSDTMTPRASIDLIRKYTQSAPAPASAVEEKSVPEYKYVGEAFDCYVMIEQGDELLVIDKHAAHERVIFEELNKNRKSDGRVGSQTLILPISLILTPDEISAVREFSEEFTMVGFDFYVSSDKVVDITAIPDAISVSDAENLFVTMADEIFEGKGSPLITEEIRREKALYQVACKAAIKGGRSYTRQVIDWLIGKVLQLPDITVCPHGRPIAYKLKKSELDRQFDRIK